MIVLYLLIIFAILILAFFAATIYFFYIGFVRMNIGNLEDIDDPGNKPLQKYRETIANGLDYIKTRQYEWVHIVSFDGLRLAARYYNNHSQNTIILFHGYRSAAARDFSCAVEMYTKLGLNVLLVDQRSHGMSEGRLITFGIKESQDVLSWINFANEKLSAKKIVLGGMSMGATTVLLACRLNLPKNVKAIIADSGFTSPIDIIKKVAKTSLKVNASPFLPIINFYCKLFGSFSLYESNTIDAVKDSKIPILFFHGKEDNFVPFKMSVKGYNSAKNNAQIFLIDNADHGMSFLVEHDTVFNALKSFLNTNLL